MRHCVLTTSGIDDWRRCFTVGTNTKVQWIHKSMLLCVIRSHLRAQRADFAPFNNSEHFQHFRTGRTPAMATGNKYTNEFLREMTITSQEVKDAVRQHHEPNSWISVLEEHGFLMHHDSNAEILPTKI